MFNTFHAISFYLFIFEISSQGHSRSFILQSITSLQWTAYRHNDNVGLNLTFRRCSRRRQPHCRLKHPPWGTPANIRIGLHLIIFLN